jgi:hypothetical protein
LFVVSELSASSAYLFAMQINGIGKLCADGEALGDVHFTLVTTPGFPAGRGELRCGAPALNEAYQSATAALFCADWGDPVEIMLVGVPDGDVADFVTVGESPRYWDE